MINMKIIKASKFPEKYIHEFLKNAHQIQVENILKAGYILEVNHTISGCFILEKMTENIYELKQFYLISTEAIKIPTLFEAVLTIAKEKSAKQVFVHSHKLMTDIILKSLNFYPHETPTFVKKSAENDGKWWSYTISD